MCLLMLGCVCVGAYEYIYPRLTLKCVLCSLSIFHTETGYISLNSEFTDYNSLVSQFVWRIPVSCSEGYNRVIDEPWYSLIIYMGAGFKSWINKHPSFIDGFFFAWYEKQCCSIPLLLMRHQVRKVSVKAAKAFSPWRKILPSIQEVSRM